MDMIALHPTSLCVYKEKIESKSTGCKFDC